MNIYRLKRDEVIINVTSHRFELVRLVHGDLQVESGEYDPNNLPEGHPVLLAAGDDYTDCTAQEFNDSLYAYVIRIMQQLNIR